jgi:hypothetical protein
MIGTWYGAYGDDGGFVLARMKVTSSHRASRR